MSISSGTAVLRVVINLVHIALFRQEIGHWLEKERGNGLKVGRKPQNWSHTFASALNG